MNDINEKNELENQESSIDEKKLTDELSEMKDQWLRAIAEMENLKKRHLKDKEEMTKYIISSFARDLLSVADNLNRAIVTTQDLPQAVLEGIQIVEKELLSVFERHGVKKIIPEGETFDPHFHQAVFEVDVDADQVGKVIQVVQPGYVVHDRLLKPAMVSVGRQKTP